MNIPTWRELNEMLRKMKRPEEAKALFDEERSNGNRKRWMRRIYSRYRVLQVAKEKKELNLG